MLLQRAQLSAQILMSKEWSMLPLPFHFLQLYGLIQKDLRRHKYVTIQKCELWSKIHYLNQDGLRIFDSIHVSASRFGAYTQKSSSLFCHTLCPWFCLLAILFKLHFTQLDYTVIVLKSWIFLFLPDNCLFAQFFVSHLILVLNLSFTSYTDFLQLNIVQVSTI